MKGNLTAQVKAALRKLKSNPHCGKILGGSLQGCRSIRVEGDKRIVYRLVEMEGRTVIVVIAIDQRRDNEVYASAAKRLSN